MHEELVYALRRIRVRVKNDQELARQVPPYLIGAAADAIEELQQRVPKVPHGRLIDADAVAKMVLDSVNQEDAQGFMFTKIICQILKDAPTIIQAEEE